MTNSGESLPANALFLEVIASILKPASRNPILACNQP